MYHGHKEEQANITTASPTERRRYECTLLIYCLNRGLYFFVHLFRLKEYMNLVHTIYLCATIRYSGDHFDINNSSNSNTVQLGRVHTA